MEVVHILVGVVAKSPLQDHNYKFELEEIHSTEVLHCCNYHCCCCILVEVHNHTLVHLVVVGNMLVMVLVDHSLGLLVAGALVDVYERRERLVIGRARRLLKVLNDTVEER